MSELVGEIRPEWSDFSKSFERLELLEGFERLELCQLKALFHSARSVSVIVPDDTLHEPPEMLPIEPINVESCCSYVRFQVGDRFAAPQVDGHSLLKGNVSCGRT